MVQTVTVGDLAQERDGKATELTRSNARLEQQVEELKASMHELEQHRERTANDFEVDRDTGVACGSTHR